MTMNRMKFILLTALFCTLAVRAFAQDTIGLDSALDRAESRRRANDYESQSRALSKQEPYLKQAPSKTTDFLFLPSEEKGSQRIIKSGKQVPRTTQREVLPTN